LSGIAPTDDPFLLMTRHHKPPALVWSRPIWDQPGPDQPEGFSTPPR